MNCNLSGGPVYTTQSFHLVCKKVNNFMSSVLLIGMGFPFCSI
jgi:hypothetical protein